MVLRRLWVRAAFTLRSLATIARPRHAPDRGSASGMIFASHSDDDTVYDALMAGDLGALDRLGPSLATARTSDGVAFLLEAVSFGSLPCVEWFLRHGADPNSADGAGQTAVDMAVCRDLFHNPMNDDLWVDDCPAILAALVRAGADVNAPGAMGLPPLHHMAILAADRQIGWLLAEGADPALPDAGSTRMTAAEHARAARKTRTADLLDAASQPSNR